MSAEGRGRAARTSIRSPRRPLLIGAVLAALLAVGISGCTKAATIQDASSNDWSDRMTQFLTDPKGQGGGGGGLSSQEDGKPTTPSRLSRGSMHPGRYDVLVVCRGADVVHLRVTAGRPAAAPRAVLAASDVPCGATARIQVRFPSDSANFSATTSTGGADAEWWMQIVRREWQPRPVQYG